MADFSVHTKATAPEAAQPILDTVQEKYGFVPNLIGVLAEAPVAAEAYMAMTGLAMKTSFTPAERTVAWMTFNTYHDCGYCMAAHTGVAKGESVPDALIETARAGESYDDPKLEALRQFALKLAENRGWAAPEDVEAFLAAGFTKSQVLELVVVLAHKVLSNYSNHLADTPVDEAFSAFAWQKTASASA